MLKERKKSEIFLLVLQSVFSVFLFVSGIINTNFRWLFLIAALCMAWGVYVLWTEPESIDRNNVGNEVPDIRLQRLKERLTNEMNPVRRARIRSQIMEMRLRNGR